MHPPPAQAHPRKIDGREHGERGDRGALGEALERHGCNPHRRLVTLGGHSTSADRASGRTR